MYQTVGFEAAQGAQQTLREWRQATLVWSGNLRQWCEGMTVFIACRPALDAVDLMLAWARFTVGKTLGLLLSSSVYSYTDLNHFVWSP